MEDSKLVGTLMYTGVGLGAFGAGMYRGMAKANGVDIPVGLDALATFAPPAVGAFTGTYAQNKIDSPRGDMWGIGEAINGMFGLAIGGALGVGAEFVGYFAGYFGARLM